MKKPVRTVVLLLCFAVFVFSTVQVSNWWSRSIQSARTYSDLTALAPVPAPQESGGTETGEESDIPWPQVDFEALSAANPDVVGWLYGEDTSIHYPVVQGSDNDYYLSHLFDGTANSNGCLFLDCRVAANFSEGNSIIYGHYLTDGTMFTSLSGYKQQDYYDAHPRLLLVTPEERFVVELFSGYVAGVTDEAWRTRFSTSEEWEVWLEEITERSVFESKVQPTLEDRILTLSTCSYEFENAQFVVHGILRQSG